MLTRIPKTWMIITRNNNNDAFNNHTIDLIRVQ